MKKTIILGIIGLCLNSCEGFTDKTWSIQNSSNDTLEVYYKSTIDDDTSHLTIAPSNCAQLKFSSNMGGQSKAQNPGDKFVFLEVTNNGMLTNKNYLFQENWQIEVDRIRRAPARYEHIYVFTLSNSDF